MAIDWGDAAGWAGVVVSLLASGAALWVSLVSRRDSRRSADAAERSAAAAERHIALAEEEASRYSPPWEIEHVQKSRYRLVNAGAEPAYDVTLDADFVIDAPVRQDVIGPKGSITFLEARSYGTKDDAVTVTWRRHGPNGEQHTWRHSL